MFRWQRLVSKGREDQEEIGEGVGIGLGQRGVGLMD